MRPKCGFDNRDKSKYLIMGIVRWSVTLLDPKREAEPAWARDCAADLHSVAAKARMECSSATSVDDPLTILQVLSLEFDD